MAYIGRDTDKLSNIEVLDAITFDGSSSYTLQKNSVNFTPSSANNVLVSIDGVVQANNFTVSGSTIDFGVAVPGTSTCDWIYHIGVGLITTPADGTVTTAKLADGSVTSAKLASGTGGKVLQVLQNSTTTTTSVTSTSYVDVGLSQAITPSSTSSKILVIAFCSGGSAAATSSGDDSFVALARDIGGAGYSNIGGGGNIASDAFIHWSAGNGSNGSYNDLQWSIQKGTFLYLDSPASTSECTYKLQQKNRNASKQTYFNRRGGDTLSSISYLTLMEIAG